MYLDASTVPISTTIQHVHFQASLLTSTSSVPSEGCGLSDRVIFALDRMALGQLDEEARTYTRCKARNLPSGGPSGRGSTTQDSSNFECRALLIQCRSDEDEIAGRHEPALLLH